MNKMEREKIVSKNGVKGPKLLLIWLSNFAPPTASLFARGKLRFWWGAGGDGDRNVQNRRLLKLSKILIQ